ncbi:tetratricopeptide repeat protein [Streptomyces shenzhenensis]
MLTEADWTAGDLARAVNFLGRAQSLTLRYDRTSVAHWIAGSRPRSPVPELVAAALSRRTGRLITPEATGLATASEHDDWLMSPETAQSSPTRYLVDIAHADTDPYRRAFLTRSAYTLTAVVLHDWSLPRTTPPTRGRRATTADVEILQEMVHLVADRAEHRGGGHGRSALAAYLADDVSRVLALSASAPVRRDLLAACAELTHLLAQITDDAGYPGLAQRYFHTALGLAGEAGHRTLYAITLRAMSAQALRMHQYKYAAELAEGALQTVGTDAGHAVMAFLLSQRAVAHSHGGEQRLALKDLTDAETRHGQATSPSGPFTAYPRAGLDYQRAQALMRLGRRADAVVAFQDCLRHRSPAHRRSQALTQARLAELLLEGGHVEQACVHWNLFLDHYPHIRSNHMDEAFIRLRSALRPHRRQRRVVSLWDRVVEQRGPHITS